MNVLHFHRGRAVIEVDLDDALLLANAVGSDADALKTHPVAAPLALATLETVAVALRYMTLDAAENDVSSATEA